MCQAIDEEFILDVLANYTTYKTYWKIEKTVVEDPEYETRKAKQAIARFVSLHPHAIGQKVEIMVEHFRHHTPRRRSAAARRRWSSPRRRSKPSGTSSRSTSTSRTRIH
jgi:type I restriction enzyme, R subunit